MVVEIDDLDVTMSWWHRTGVGVYEATSEGLVYSVPEAATALLHTFALLTLALLRRRARSG